MDRRAEAPRPDLNLPPWTRATRADVTAARERLAARRQGRSSGDDRIIVTEQGLASTESMIGELLEAHRPDTA